MKYDKEEYDLHDWKEVAHVIGHGYFNKVMWCKACGAICDYDTINFPYDTDVSC